MFDNIRSFLRNKQAESSMNAHKDVGQKALLRLSADLSSKLSEDEVCWAVVNGLQDTLGYDIVALYLLDQATGDRVHAAHVGFVGPPERMSPGEGISELCLLEGKLRYTPDVSLEKNYSYGVWGSEVDIPVRIGEELIGVMIVERKDKNAFDQSDFEVLTAAVQQAGIAINNARLFEQAQREISERKKAEQRLQEYQEHLTELVDARTTELIESEQRYRSLFDGIPVGVYRTTPAGQVEDANLALIQMMGFPDRENYLNINLTSVYVNPDDRKKWQSLMEKEGIVRDFEVQLRRYDGQIIWASDTARAVIDEYGKVQYYEGTIEDISERKKAQEELQKYQEHLEELVEERTAELQESEQRYRTLFDGVPVGLYRATPEGKLLDANKAFVQMLGYETRDELLEIESTSLHYIDPKQREKWKGLMDRKGVVRDFEIYGRTLNGEIGWYSDTSHAVKDENGHALYYEGRVENITRRKQYEEEIKHQKEYFEALFVNSPTAIMTVDLNGDVVAWNPHAEKLFGYTAEEAIGKNIDSLVAKHPSVSEEAKGFTERALLSKGLEGMVHSVTKRTRKDGSLVDVELLSVPVIVSGEVVGFIGIYHDIRELQEARRAAEAANQAKSVFLANMSHELRTPLNAILGFSQLMERDLSLNADQKEYLGIINRSGEHLLSLINDVLEVSKIEAGQVNINNKNFDIYHMLDSLEEMFNLRTEQKGLKLNIERSQDVPQFINSDEGKLRQVISNLLGNAIKFTKEGSVCLRTWLTYEDHKRQILHFAVEDTGPGIPDDDLLKVFDPFIQATAVDQFQEGSGLGLTISRQYVNQMGGELIAKSELGVGSVFSFEIPVVIVEDELMETKQVERKALRLAPDQRASDGSSFRLLIAEDDESNRHLLLCLLESLGFDVQAAEDGRQTLNVWQEWNPQLIWMDMRMPVVDGYQATKLIKKTKQGQSTKIIALTASAFEEDRERILIEGCDDFLRKPFRAEEVTALLEKHLGVRFIYEDGLEKTLKMRKGTTKQPLHEGLVETLESLPKQWLVEFKAAAIEADTELMLALINKICDDKPRFAAEMSKMVSDYKYRKIVELIENTGRIT